MEKHKFSLALQDHTSNEPSTVSGFGIYRQHSQSLNSGKSSSGCYSVVAVAILELQVVLLQLALG